MSWTTPRTWSPGETETSAIFNLHLRDQLNVIKTPMDSGPRTIIGGAGRGYGGSAVSGVNACPAGSVDTVMTGCSLSIPPNTWYNYGDTLILETRGLFAANANAKLVKVRVGAAAAVTIYTGSPNGTYWWSRHMLLCNSSTVVLIYGATHVGSASLGAVTTLICNGSFSGLASVLTNTLALDVLTNGVAASDVVIQDWNLSYALSLSGAVV